MQDLLTGLSNTIGQAVSNALVANQEQMNKAVKAAINAWHEKSRPEGGEMLLISKHETKN